MRLSTKQRTLLGGVFALLVALVVIATGNTLGLYSASESQGGNALNGASFSPATAPTPTATAAAASVSISWSSVSLTGGSHTGTIKYTVTRVEDSAVICSLTTATTCTDNTGTFGVSYTYTERPFYVVGSTSTWSLSASAASSSVTYPTRPSTTCSTSYSLPAYTTVRFIAIGGSGGNGAAGAGSGHGNGGTGAPGAKVTGILSNTTSAPITLTCNVGLKGTSATNRNGQSGGSGDAVGGNGTNGTNSNPDSGGAGGGGGASAIKVGANYVALAGGGGGGGGGGATGGNGGSATANVTLSTTAPGSDTAGPSGTANGSNSGGGAGGGGAGMTVGPAATPGTSSTAGGNAGASGSSYAGGGAGLSVANPAVASGTAGQDGSISFAVTSGLVQSVGGIVSTGSGSSLALTPTQATVAGDLIVVNAFVPGGGTATVTVTDSASNSYTVQSLTTAGSGATTTKAVFAYVNSASSVGTAGNITVSAGQASRISATFEEFVGYSGGLDQSNSATASTAAASSGNTPTTTNANDLLVGGVGWHSGSATLGSTTAGFATTTQASTTGSEMLAYEPVSATSAYSFGGTLSVATDWGAFIYAFKQG